MLAGETMPQSQNEVPTYYYIIRRVPFSTVMLNQ